MVAALVVAKPADGSCVLELGGFCSSSSGDSAGCLHELLHNLHAFMKLVSVPEARLCSQQQSMGAKD